MRRDFLASKASNFGALPSLLAGIVDANRKLTIF